MYIGHAGEGPRWSSASVEDGRVHSTKLAEPQVAKLCLPASGGAQ